MKRTGFIDLQRADIPAGASDQNMLPPASIYIFREGAGGYQLEKSLEYSGQPASALSSDLHGIEEFCLSLPFGMLDFRMLKLPFSDREKLRKIIPFELDNLIVDGSESIVFDFIVLGSSDSNFEILVAYVKKSLLRSILEKLALLNIEPRVVSSIDFESVLRDGKHAVAERIMNAGTVPADGRTAGAREALGGTVINLRTGPFLFMKDQEKALKLLKTTTVLLLLLAFLIHADLAFRFFSSKAVTRSAKQEMRSMYTRLFPEDRRISDELYQMKAQAAEMKEKAEAMNSIAPLEFLKTLSQDMTEGILFNEISLDRDLITMKGEAVSIENTDELKKRLSEFAPDVSVTDIKPASGGKTFFTVVVRNFRKE